MKINRINKIIEAIINLALGLCVLLLSLSFILKLLGAKLESGIVRNINFYSDLILSPVQPFSNYIPDFSLSTEFIVDFMPILGIILISLLNYTLLQGIRTLTNLKRK